MLPPRLALRFAAVGLAQMVTIAVGFAIILEANRPLPRSAADASLQRIAGNLAPALRTLDESTARDALVRARGSTDRAILTLTDAAGRIVASTDPSSPRCPAEPLGPPRTEAATPRPTQDWPLFHCVSAVVALGAGEGRLHYVSAPPLPPSALGARIVPLVLLVVAAFSLLLARSLVVPLGKLSTAARAFGGGDRSARASFDRGDEVGDVARAFDDMADRVTQLLRAEKELIANISHELRTPLARIRVAVDLATEGDATVTREVLVDIAEDLDELERLIADVLTTARLDLADANATSNGAPPLHLAPLDLGALVRLAADRFRAAHQDRTLAIDAADDAPPTHVLGDAVLLRRSLENLLENAHTYTVEADAPLTVRLRQDGDHAIVAIIDRGIGISEADLRDVFRPFFRADKSRARRTGGLGLGLALTKRIVEAHGGTVTIASELERGTTATIRLPMVDAE